MDPAHAGNPGSRLMLRTPHPTDAPHRSHSPNHHLLHIPNLTRPIPLPTRRRRRAPHAEIIHRIHVQVLASRGVGGRGPAVVGA